MKRICLILAIALRSLRAASAQQVVAPTPDQVGPPRGENTGDYNITQSFETGYRFSPIFRQHRAISNPMLTTVTESACWAAP